MQNVWAALQWDNLANTEQHCSALLKRSYSEFASHADIYLPWCKEEFPSSMSMSMSTALYQWTLTLTLQRGIALHFILFATELFLHWQGSCRQKCMNYTKYFIYFIHETERPQNRGSAYKDKLNHTSWCSAHLSPYWQCWHSFYNSRLQPWCHNFG